MGLLLSLLGIGAAMTAIQGASEASDVHKGFMNSHQKKEFDQMNARDGIHIAEIDKIAARCKVRGNKWGTLPAEGYLHCLKYVRKYANHPSDVDLFIETWKRHVERQAFEEPEKIKNSKLAAKYPTRARIVQREAKTVDKNNLMTFEITHWKGIPKAAHIKRMNDIATKTCMKEILAQKPVLRWAAKVPDAYTEYWTIYGQPGERFDDWLVRKAFEATYTDCCAHLGYDAAL